jgi:protein-disulfide isomerase
MKRLYSTTVLPLILVLVLALFAPNLSSAQWKIQKTPPASQHTNLSVSPSKGPADAPVVMGVFTDFQCSACARLAPRLEQLLEKYPLQVRLVFKNYPLRRHTFAKKAAVAALAARRQGKFWEYHDLLFENGDSLNDEKFRHIARELGLDLDTFEKDLNDLKLVARVNQDIRLGAYMGVRGTPTLFINGKVSRARTLEALEAAVQNELEQTRKGPVVSGGGKG